MAIELGSNFPQRWQRAPMDFRQKVFDELQDICRSLGGQAYERVIAGPMALTPPPVMPSAQTLVSAAIASVNVSPVEQELKKSFLQNADDLIEQHLDSVRQELRNWLHGEMNRLLRETLKK